MASENDVKRKLIHMCAKATMEEFEALLKESFEIDTPEEGTVVKGTVIAIEAGQAIIDVGYKMEGRIDLKEFANPGEQPNINVGDTSRSISTASRTPAAKPRSAARRPAAKKPGTVWKRPMPTETARRWRDLRPRQGRLHRRSGRRCCVPARAARSTCARCAMPAR